MIGEPVWPSRSEVEYPACVQHEALINRAFTGRDITVVCPYDVAQLDPDVIADARRTHPVLWQDGVFEQEQPGIRPGSDVVPLQPTTVERPDRSQVHGAEIGDLSRRSGFRRLLRAVVRHVPDQNRGSAVDRQ